LLNSRGQLKVTDFGLSRDIRPTGEPDPAHPRIVGTDLYMSPQQWTGEAPAVADDIYSLGATIYELLTGNPPFYEGDVFKQLFEMTPPTMTERLHALGIDDIVIPLIWEETVAACLAKEADRRPVSAREVALRLELLEGAKPATPVPSTDTTPQTPAPDTPEMEVATPAAPGNAPEAAALRSQLQFLVAFIYERARWIASLASGWLRARRPVRLGAAAICVLLVISLVWLVGHHLAKARPGSAGGIAPSTPPPVGEPWQNSLGMRFVSVTGTPVLFSVWETRVQDFDAFVRATGYDMGLDVFQLNSASQWRQTGSSWRNPDFPQATNAPVVGVTWRDAEKFCEWLTARERKRGVLGTNQSYRLPRVTEWIFAAGTTLYPWGNNWPPPPGAGNYAGAELLQTVTNHPVISAYRDGFSGTSPVGSFESNAFGIYDLGGNVWEFCADGPAGVPNARWLMGGSWADSEKEVLSISNRALGEGNRRYSHRGFRCILALNEPGSPSRP
jgi:hypothetical protein